MEKTSSTCPRCGSITGQLKKGYNRSGTQRRLCKECGVTYTKEPKKREYPKETRELAIKMYYSGVSGRGVGKVLGMNKANVYSWIKKTDEYVDNAPAVLELDELYWFIERKPCTATRENVYFMTMVSREPREIVGWEVSSNKAAHTIQCMVDRAPEAALYCTDGYMGYLDVIFPGKHKRNIHNKSDTYTVESVNADLRHYIPILARRSRCFARSLETLRAVVDVFADAYNRFGRAKHKYRLTHEFGEVPFAIVDFL